MDRITAAEVFVQVVERGSMAAAADALDMSRAMVTRYVTQMERWAGARLLHRTTRRLGLSAAGEETLARCRRMLAVAVGMPVQAAQAPDAVQGLLRVACVHSLAQDVLVPMLDDFLRQHPNAAIDLRIDARPVNLVEERIDLAIRITNDLDPNLVARRLGDSVVCATPGYLATHGTPMRPEDLGAHACLTYSYFGSSVWEFDGPSGRHTGVPVGGPLSANESHVLLGAALRGMGIVLQPAYAVERLIAAGHLVALLPGYTPAGFGIHAVFQTRQLMPQVLRVLLDDLAARFAIAFPRRAGSPAQTSARALKVRGNSTARARSRSR